MDVDREMSLSWMCIRGMDKEIKNGDIYADGLHGTEIYIRL